MGNEEAKTKSDTSRVLVMFGFDDKPQPRAGTFEAADFDAARKAAKTLELNVYETDPGLLRAALKKVMPGQIAATGYSVIQRMKRSDYDLLIAGIAATRTTPVEAAINVFPTSWEAIAKDSLVLAQADVAEEGWFESIVTKVEGSILTLMWRGHEMLPKFKRHISAVALLRPPSAQ